MPQHSLPAKSDKARLYKKLGFVTPPHALNFILIDLLEIDTRKEKNNAKVSRIRNLYHDQIFLA